MSTATAQIAAARDVPLMIADPVVFFTTFNKNAFRFDHTLSGHPLFATSRLEKLAHTIAPDHAHMILGLSQANARIRLCHVQRDPAYAALLDELMAEITGHIGLSPDQIRWPQADILLAAPNTTTPYHIDHESTFVLQIHGHRKAHIWDPRDREVLSEPEIEAFYAGHANAARFNPDTKHRANSFALTAGTGLHHPSRAPHWIKTGNTVSVSLNIRFCTRDMDAAVAPYQVNHLLRRCGLTPVPPGRSPWRDVVKSSLIGALAMRKPNNKSDMLRSGYRRLTAIWPRRSSQA